MDFDILNLDQYINQDPVTYQYFNQLLNHRTVLFNTDIDEDIIEKVYLPLRDFENDDSTTPITLILNSNGGNATEGFFLAHYISHYSKPLTILATGVAASMAAVILAAGGKNENVHRVCYPSTYGLIHDGYISISSQTETKTAADLMEFSNKIDKDIRQFFIDNTNITAEQYDAKTRHQWFLSAQEMKDLNLVDEIIGSEE